jgi:hypothetical protein
LQYLKAHNSIATTPASETDVEDLIEQSSNVDQEEDMSDLIEAKIENFDEDEFKKFVDIVERLQKSGKIKAVFAPPKRLKKVNITLTRFYDFFLHRFIFENEVSDLKVTDSNFVFDSEIEFGKEYYINFRLFNESGHQLKRYSPKIDLNILSVPSYMNGHYVYGLYGDNDLLKSEILEKVIIGDRTDDNGTIGIK